MEDYKFVVKNPTILNSNRERKKLGRKILIAFTILIIGFSLVYLYNFYKNNFHLPFYIKNFKILNVNNVNIKDINKILSNYKGKSLKDLPLETVYSKIKNIEWVKDVTIHKNYPSTLIVDIEETLPISIVMLNNKFYLLGDNGKLIEHFPEKYLKKSFYIITFKNIKQFQENKKTTICLINKLNKYHIKNISEIVFNKNIVIYTYNPHIRYIVDKDNIDENLEKMNLLDKMNKLLSLKKTNFKTINLKYSNKIFIKL